ncbi:GumC family protein [Synoicihabitans lomoniglobus]|uniref:non-specific protein-tyrosine kinase n=1 Tax=Synoicihabitans lomoniglobus TaxID=2909285 RepID=A0AAF0I5P2_9BACT|nr:polysaccharide biosynthesis tyrosine autokinase [Opitutaceae bacterium LMO-M01]WED67140.1 polysaccharide biosynthesis tyrosine autokinase [Opitutaceae bacterium LMO-M01]
MSEPEENSPPRPKNPVDEQLSERRTLRDYAIILRERFWIALPLALLVSIGLGYQRAKEVPMYQSTATMRFEKPDTTIEGRSFDQAPNTAIDLNTYLQELASDQMRNRVIRSLTPEEVRILQRPYLADLEPGQEPPSVGAALGSLSVGDIRDSFIIRVGITHRDPEATALVANRFVSEFMRYLFDRRFDKTNNAAVFLEQRAETLRIEAEQAEGLLRDYQRKHNLMSLDNSTNLVRNRLVQADEARTSARLTRIRVEELLNQIERFKQQGRDMLEISYIAEHGTVKGLSNQLSELRKNESILAERYLERHPRMIVVGNEIAVTQRQLDEAINLAIADLRSTVAEARTSEQAMQQEFDVAEAEQRRLKDLEAEYSSLKNQADIARNNFVQITQRMQEVQTERRIESVPVHPLDNAQIPGAPYSPNISGIIKSSVMIFILVFVGVAVGLSFIDDRVKSAWDVEHFIGANLLGIIPDLNTLKDEEKYSLVLENRQVPGTESFLSVYSAAKIHSKLDFPKSILITSTIPGEGKTLVSCNLAGGFARHGRKTLLIDCDLRRPMLHRHFQMENDKGIITWSESGGELGESAADNSELGIVRVGENLDLLRSGGRSRIPTELLESKAFVQLLDRLQKEYELIVIDSPPLGAVTDSLLIAEHADEVIYVCRFNRAYRKHIRQYVTALKNAKRELLGIVLNGLSPRRIEYYSNYRYYRSYKKYYGAET